MGVQCVHQTLRPACRHASLKKFYCTQSMHVVLSYYSTITCVEHDLGQIIQVSIILYFAIWFQLLRKWDYRHASLRQVSIIFLYHYYFYFDLSLVARYDHNHGDKIHDTW